MTGQNGDTSILVSMFRHNTWANLRLLDACAGLDEAQLDAVAVGGYGSIHLTLTHIVRAEINYVNRATGKTYATPLPPDQFPGFDVLREAARWTGEELTQIAAHGRADDIVRVTRPDGKRAEYPLSGLLTQAINHSTEHRAQVAAIITQLGLVPPEMDAWTYMVELGVYREL